jgi:hypothetical protein
MDGGHVQMWPGDGERTRLDLNRRANPVPSSAAPIAVITWGRNIAPYCELERSYSFGSVKIVLAAGELTRTMPCRRPAT